MKLQSILLVFLSLCCFSCGLINNVSINPPTTDYTSQDSGGLILTFQHTASNNPPSTNFQGYEIFYKFYLITASSSGTFNNLLNDVSAISSSPTKDALLLSRGYKRLNLTDQVRSPEPIVGELKVSWVASDAKIVLDFTAFMNVMNLPGGPSQSNPPLPVLKITNMSNVVLDQSTLYRGVINNSNLYSSFQDLFTNQWSPFTTTTDMDPGISDSAVNGAPPIKYEMCVFVSSYAWTPDAAPVFSQPVPLGIVRPFTVRP